jgi:tight adherence protein B
VTRRFLLLCVALGASLVAAVTAAGASGPPRVTEAAGGVFPTRSYILTLPRGMQLKRGAVHVRENGRPVADVTATPVGASTGKQFGIVLVIDASTSMEGAPERAAFAAAKAFAAQRKGKELLGVVTYNVEPMVVLPLSSEKSAIDQALSTQPPFQFGTHIYDAVVRSLDLLQSQQVSAGTIVVLSDGQEHPGKNDTASHQTLTSAAAAARAAHVRVFTVGLRSRVSKLAALQRLSRDTGGRYVQATSLKQLGPIYKDLGSTLASEYLLRYRSLAGPNTHMKVEIEVDGLTGVATAQYQTPKLGVPSATAAAPYEPSVLDRIWESGLTMTIIGLLAATLIGVGTVALLSGPRKGTVRKRLAEFVSVPTAIGSSRRATTQITEKMLEGTETILRGSSRWQRFKWELQIAKINMPAEQIMVLTGVGMLLTFLLVNFVTGSLLLSVALTISIPFVVRSSLKRMLLKQRKLFAEQLPDNLQVLSSALRAGHSFIGALSVVVNDAPEPARSEFQRVVADEQLGVPIDRALQVVGERMESRELEQVALVAALQRETGGNTAEVLDQVTDTIRERFELRRTVQTLTAQGRMSRWVLTFLPLFLLLMITLINPGYMSVLYDSTTGRVILVLAGLSVISGSLVIKRIVNIKV